jgi:SAM-dependent methyltransferase
VKDDCCLPYAPRGIKEPGVRVLTFYDGHPINADGVLRSARERGAGVTRRLVADDLFEFDQDHYGGIAAVDTLATRAGIVEGSSVLDVCAGLAGPARFLASHRGCRVVALEIHAGRARGAARLTHAVNLADRVRVVRGDARALPFAPRSFDACISQEALLHVDDKAAVLANCRRVLVTGGRLAFTDWIARPRLSDAERERLWRWMAATNILTLDGYRRLLGDAGLHAIDAEDLSDEWRPILRRRLEMYRDLGRDAARRYGEERFAAYLELYAFFVRLVDDGKVGGGRFTATA